MSQFDALLMTDSVVAGGNIELTFLGASNAKHVLSFPVAIAADLGKAIVSLGVQTPPPIGGQHFVRHVKTTKVGQAHEDRMVVFQVDDDPLLGLHPDHATKFGSELIDWAKRVRASPPPQQQ